uniref:Uncharacterized protein n=1 Tax=Zea mays TaxID=4577 RepID=C0PKK3_MAIZE|nr:unknown [Zea mays]
MHGCTHTGTLRARRPCQRSRRRRSCSDHGVGDGGDSSSSTRTTTAVKTIRTNQNHYAKHIYRLLSTYCRTKDLCINICVRPYHHRTGIKLAISLLHDREIARVRVIKYYRCMYDACVCVSIYHVMVCI